MALKCTPDIRNYPVYNNHNSLPGALYSLKTFKRMFAATSHQAKIFLRLEHQQKNEENDQKYMNYEDHRDSAKRPNDLWTPHKISKNSKNFRAVAGSGAEALNFDQISVRLSQL